MHANSYISVNRHYKLDFHRSYIENIKIMLQKYLCNVCLAVVNFGVLSSFSRSVEFMSPTVTPCNKINLFSEGIVFR